jgi:ribonuclease P protein subunit RPR2
MRRRGGEFRQIARERIDLLLDLAAEKLRADPTLSRRYVRLARLIGMKAGVRLDREAKMFVCRKCDTLLRPGLSARVRTRSERGTILVITCLNCGAIKRYPATREKRASREQTKN